MSTKDLNETTDVDFRLDKFPAELILMFFENPILCLDDVCNLSQTCKKFYDIVKYNYKRFKGKFPFFNITVYPLYNGLYEIEVVFYMIMKHPSVKSNVLSLCKPLHFIWEYYVNSEQEIRQLIHLLTFKNTINQRITLPFVVTQANEDLIRHIDVDAYQHIIGLNGFSISKDIFVETVNITQKIMSLKFPNRKYSESKKQMLGTFTLRKNGELVCKDLENKDRRVYEYIPNK
jgi:hypothetical protein